MASVDPLKINSQNKTRRGHSNRMFFRLSATNDNKCHDYSYEKSVMRHNCYDENEMFTHASFSVNENPPVAASQPPNSARAHARGTTVNSHDHTFAGTLRWLMLAFTRWLLN
jgi:hypothetical protein